MKNLTLLSTLFVLLAAQVALGQIPQTMSYQGVLTDANGDPVADGQVALTFKLYDVAAGGTKLWEEMQQVDVAGGLFNVILGSSKPLNLSFDSPYWLGISLGGGSELDPRIELTAAAYSLMARSIADGEVVKSLNSLKDNVTLAAGNNVTIQQNGHKLTISAAGGGAGDGHSLDAADGNPVDALFVDNAGKVGIGTTRPSSKLHVKDNIFSDRVTYPGFGLKVKGAIKGFLWYDTDNDILQLGSGATNNGISVKTTNGNVGIGTKSPNSKTKLHVVSDSGPGTTGIRGKSITGIGVLGQSDKGSGIGVYAINLNGIAVRGQSITGLAGEFLGKVNVTGTLTKGGGAFKIDHPLDPANMYLYHSFVESPDMKNVYDGVVALDGNGEAWVKLPGWFEVLNNDFRYQLTCIGGFAQVYIAEEISNNRFMIAGGSAGLKVSWQVTGIRKDPFAQANRIPVEVWKSPKEAGKYLHPQAYGLPENTGIFYAEQQRGVEFE